MQTDAPVTTAPETTTMVTAVPPLESRFLDYGTKVAGVIIVLTVAWIVAAWVRRAAVGALQRAKLDITVSKFFANAARWLLLAMAVLACLEIFGVKTTSFAALIGAAGLAIGLGFQGSLSNLASGIMLLIFRPFKVGDVINVAGQTGKVDEIELFTTTIDTSDNRRIILPNSSIFGSTIENMTYHGKRRIDIAIGVDYAADIDTTRRVLLEAASGVPGRLPADEPAVILSDLGASAVNWQVQLWARTDQFGGVKQAAVQAVKEALDGAGIGIPFPQLDIRLCQPLPPPVQG